MSEYVGRVEMGTEGRPSSQELSTTTPSLLFPFVHSTSSNLSLSSTFQVAYKPFLIFEN